MPSSPAVEATTVKAATMETAEMACAGKTLRGFPIECVRMTIAMVLPGMVHFKAGLAAPKTTQYGA